MDEDILGRIADVAADLTDALRAEGALAEGQSIRFDTTPLYRERTDGYVPTPFTDSGLRPAWSVIVGNPSNDRQPATVVPVALGLADELNRDRRTWFWAQVEPGDAETPEHWSHFDGWDVIVGIDIQTWNSRRVHDWKGYDEIDKSGRWRVTFNGTVVTGDDSGRAPLDVMMRRIEREIANLRAIGPIDWRRPGGEYRDQIEGRRVYYRDTPAVLDHWMPEQGCVMARAVEGGPDFPPRAYDVDERTGTDENPEHNYSDEWRREVKIHLTSDDIWWWRKRAFGVEDTDG